MAVMGFSVHPGPLPFMTVRDAEKWLPRLTNGQVEIRGEGIDLPHQMVSVAGLTYPFTADEARRRGLYVPPVYAGRKLVLVKLEALSA